MEDSGTVCQRRWIPNDSLKKTDSDLTVMTYNILSDEYIRTGEYTYCPAGFRYQKSRTAHIVSEVEFYSPDVVCFQEVAEDHFASILSISLEKIGYAGRHMSYTYRANDGLCMFYKRDKLSLVDIGKYQHGELIKALAGEAHIDNKYSTVVDNLEKLSCGMLVGRLTHVNSGKEIVIGNLQVTWTDFQLPCLHTIEVAVSFLALKEAAGGSPFILCGDFNSPPTFAPYHLLSRGHLAPDDPVLDYFPEFRLYAIQSPTYGCLEQCETIEVSCADKMEEQAALSSKKTTEINKVVQCILNSFLHSFSTAGCPVKSAYKIVVGAEPDMTNCDAEAWKGFVHEICVDYFWYTQDLTPSGVLATPSRESMRKHLALPSVLHPSDHIPLLAGFKIL